MLSMKTPLLMVVWHPRVLALHQMVHSKVVHLRVIKPLLQPPLMRLIRMQMCCSFLKVVKDLMQLDLLMLLTQPQLTMVHSLMAMILIWLQSPKIQLGLDPMRMQLEILSISTCQHLRTQLLPILLR